MFSVSHNDIEHSVYVSASELFPLAYGPPGLLVLFQMAGYNSFSSWLILHNV